MSKVCGKYVDSLRIAYGKSRAYLSTAAHFHMIPTAALRVKVLVSRTIIPCISQPYPQVKMAPLPLIEHYFYPVSTAPTTNSTK